MFFEVGQPVAAGELPLPPTKEEIEKLLAAAADTASRMKLLPHG